jgi:2,3-bisphosphoglycerate-dependent phosphoglycerate mutase
MALYFRGHRVLATMVHRALLHRCLIVVLVILVVTSQFFALALVPPNSDYLSAPTTSLASTSSTSSPAPLPLLQNAAVGPIRIVHTLLLCRHGDSIWNGGEPGCRETFTGWTDVPLSQKGIREAANTGRQLSQYYRLGIDACCTLQRAQLTAHYCIWAFSDQPSHVSPRKYIQDFRLNERHYGALQGLVKEDVERGLYGHDAEQVQRWRRSWYEVPPLLLDEEDDPRRLQEVKKFSTMCGGAENVPRGESLAQVAHNRIKPFLEQVLCPILDEATESRRHQQEQQQVQNFNNHDDGGGGGSSSDTTTMGGTGLIVAHANSLRALIGVLCDIENGPPEALKRLEKMRLPTGVPLVLKFCCQRQQQCSDGGSGGNAGSYYYQVCDLEGLPVLDQYNRGDLPVFPLSCIPMNSQQKQQQQQQKQQN